MNSLDVPRWVGGDAPQLAAPAPAPAPRDDLRGVRLGYCALVVAAAVLQLVIFGRAPDNLLATPLALVSSLIGIGYALNGERFRAFPISALILLFYTTTSTSGALIVKTLEWTPLTDRLLVPKTTFAVLLATQLILLAADYVYLRLRPLHVARGFISRRLLQPVGAIRWPGDWQFWLLGVLGCISLAMTGTDHESDASFGMASAGEKVIRLFSFLKFAPFMIPFRDAMSGVPSRTRVPVLALAAYFGGLVVLSFATNSRSTFADAVPTIGICVLIAVGMGRLDFRRIPTATLVLSALGAAALSVLLSRIALAMVVVRDYRQTVDVFTLVRMTIEALFNSEWLEVAKSRMDSSINIGDYSETYVDSRFFARFLLTKFHDTILYYISLMGPDQLTAYQGFMEDRLGAMLPDPLLRLFNIPINKQDLVVSNGDFVVYLVDGWGLGGFKTGSMIGEVYGIFGWMFPVVILAAALLLFLFHDAFVVPTANGRLAFSPMIVLLIWNLVGTTAAFGLGAETVTQIPSNILRGLPQTVLAYGLALLLVRGLGKVAGYEDSS